MKHIVDLESWERRGNYTFFRDHLNAWYSVTTELDCTESYEQSKQTGRSFFLRYLYAALRAANEVPAFRYRMDAQGQIVWYDTVDIITPIALPSGNFCTVRIPYQVDFDEFAARAEHLIQENARSGDPYGVEQSIFASGEYDIVHLSAVPRLYFTAMTYTWYRIGQGCTHPLMTAGKAISRAERWVMPFSVYVNHAFVDGSHLSTFFEKMQSFLSSPLDRMSSSANKEGALG